MRHRQSSSTLSSAPTGPMTTPSAERNVSGLIATGHILTTNRTARSALLPVGASQMPTCLLSATTPAGKRQRAEPGLTGAGRASVFLDRNAPMTRAARSWPRHAAWSPAGGSRAARPGAGSALDLAGMHQFGAILAPGEPRAGSRGGVRWRVVRRPRTPRRAEPATVEAVGRRQRSFPRGSLPRGPSRPRRSLGCPALSTGSTPASHRPWRHPSR